MIQYRFSLEKYKGIKSRHICPRCGKKEFAMYVDNETGHILDEKVGKCNRIEKCAYHFPPKLFFESVGTMPLHLSKNYTLQSKNMIEKPTFFCEEKELICSQHSANNVSNLSEFLSKVFAKDKVVQTLEKYGVGAYGRAEDAAKNFYRSTIFWQIDMQNKIRCGKVMQYNPESGKRVKEHNKFRFSWIRNTDGETELRQVFFGIHLLKYFPTYEVGLVESEKTALLADLYFDKKIIWISAGSLEGINERKFRDLGGRKVILFPDLSSINSKNPAIENWKKKVTALGKKVNVDVSINNYLDLFASEFERENQDDLGDFILRNCKPEKP